MESFFTGQNLEEPVENKQSVHPKVYPVSKYYNQPECLQKVLLTIFHNSKSVAKMSVARISVSKMSVDKIRQTDGQMVRRTDGQMDRQTDEVNLCLLKD